MDIQAVCTAIADTIQNQIDGLRGYDVAPDSPLLPCVVVTLDTSTEEETFDLAMRPFNVNVLTSTANKVVGQQMLMQYLSTSGVQSIRRAIEVDPTLGGVVSGSWVEAELSSYGTTTDQAGTEYYSGRMRVTVWEPR